MLIGGRDVTSLPPEQRRIGLVFQSYALFPHLSVFENVAYGLRARGREAAAIGPAVRRALEMVNLADREGAVDQLSGGEQQRVAVARAVVTEPDLLLLDEPLSNLDPSLRHRMRVSLRSILKTLGIPSLHVTHDQEEALAIADRIAVLDSGRLVQVGTPDDLYHRPRTAFVAALRRTRERRPRPGRRIARGLASTPSPGTAFRCPRPPTTASPTAPRSTSHCGPEVFELVTEGSGASGLRSARPQPHLSRRDRRAPVRDRRRRPRDPAPEPRSSGRAQRAIRCVSASVPPASTRWRPRASPLHHEDRRPCSAGRLPGSGSKRVEVPADRVAGATTTSCSDGRPEMRARSVVPAILVALVLVPSVLQPIFELVRGSLAGDGARALRADPQPLRPPARALAQPRASRS